MAKTDVTLTVGADVASATKEIKKFTKEGSKALKGLQGSFDALKIAGGAVAAVFAGRALFDGISKVTNAAIIQENAVKKLNTALQLSGDYSAEASKDMQDFASNLQSITTIGDETSLEMLALAKTFGLTNDKAKELVTAAVDLSSVTQLSLESAVINLGKSFAGMSGELGEVISGIRDLTAEELKAGAAVDLVGKKFGGAAASITQTFGGASTQLSGIFGDFQEALGGIITKNPAFIKGIQIMSNVFKNLIGLIDANRDTIIKLVNRGFLFMVKQIPVVIKGVEFMVRAVQGVALGFDVAKQASAEFGLAIIDLGESNEVFKSLLVGVNTLRVGLLNAADNILAIIEKISFGTIDLGPTREAIADEAAAIVEILDFPEETTKGLRDQLIEIRDEALESGGKVDEFFGQVRDGITVVEGLANDAANAIQQVVEDTESGTISGVADLENNLNNISTDGAVEKFVESIKKNKLTIATQIAAAVGKGAEGARDILVKGVTAGAEALLPGVGAFAGELTKLLTQDPEQLKATVNAFVEAVPELLNAIAENIDVVVTSLIDSLLINGGIEKIAGALIRALVQGTVEMGKAFVDGIGSAWTAFLENEALKSFGNVIIDEWQKSYDNFVNGWAAIRDELFAFEFESPPWLEKLESIFSGDKGVRKGKGPLERALNVDIKGVAFAEGGMVSKVRGGGPVDSVPALVSPGEIVVDRTNSKRLETFLTNADDQNMRIMTLLANIANLVQQPMTVNTTAEVNGNAIADIILELNRKNARLA